MAENFEGAGVSIRRLEDRKVASLRYYEERGSFGGDVRGVLGGPLPEQGRVVCYSRESDAELVLAWRGPTETLLVTANGDAFAAVIRGIEQNTTAGCVVDQTGGFWAWCLSGPRAGDLLLRLGGNASVPSLYEARLSRLAEVPVLAMSLLADQIVLIVERIYSNHLMGWLRETAADL